MDKYKKVNIDQIFGYSGSEKFGTMELEVYEKKINDMTKIDLQMHSSKVGVVPRDNTTLMRRELLKAFNHHVVDYTVPKNEPKKRGRKKKQDAKAMAQIASLLKEAGAVNV
tara:strand:+ start:118315 stop:118647 length:333 start_codon:yes stop_codon:yes gene_type:complete